MWFAQLMVRFGSFASEVPEAVNMAGGLFYARLTDRDEHGPPVHAGRIFEG